MWQQLSYNLILATLFSFLGLACFGIGFFLFDRLTPFKLWKELLEEHNIALAIVVGSVALGLCIIIAAAIH